MASCSWCWWCSWCSWERALARLIKACKIAQDWQKLREFSTIFRQIFERWERCEGVHRVDLVKGFPTGIFLQNLASMQPRTSPCEIHSRLQVWQKLRNFSAIFRQIFERWERCKGVSVSCRSRQGLANAYFLAKSGFGERANKLGRLYHLLGGCTWMDCYIVIITVCYCLQHMEVWNIEVWAVQKHTNLVDLVKNFAQNGVGVLYQFCGAQKNAQKNNIE